MKKIVLINPPYEKISKGFDCVDNITNKSPSLGLLYLAAKLKEDQFDVEIIESDINSLSVEEVVEQVIKTNPEFIGITLFTVGVTNGALIASEVKKHLPEVKIIVGGPHISSMGYETMKRFVSFDLAVLHEGELVISKILNNYINNISHNTIGGIIYRDSNNELIATPPSKEQIELDDLPLPAWELLSDFPNKYPLAIFDYPKGPVATFSASRGCPFKCEFCDTSTFGSKIRYYSPQKVFEIMKMLQDKYQIQHLQFVDDLFVANQKRIGQLCDLIIENNFKMTWSCTARVDTISLEILKKMKKAGCWEISYGLESGSDEMLKGMRKATKVEQARKAIHWTDEAGIRSKGLFMLGYPNETKESIAQTKEFIQEIPLTTMNLSKFTPYPGTPIYIKLYGTSIRDEDWDRMNGMNFIYEPENLSMETLNSEYRNILEGFYKRNTILIHYIKTGIKYPLHFKRLFKLLLCNMKQKLFKPKAQA